MPGMDDNVRLAKLRDTKASKIDLNYNKVSHEFVLWQWQEVHAGGGVINTIKLSPVEFIEMLRAGFEHYKIPSGVVNAVLPKLSKANVVR